MSKGRYHIDLARAIAPTVEAEGLRGWQYAPELQLIDRGRISGVYVILQGSQVLYVGESHTGRLFDTITRHFRRWTKSNGYRDGRRRGGTTYDKFKVRVVWRECPAGDAQELQYRLIQRLAPRDNETDGCSAVDDGGCSIPV